MNPAPKLSVQNLVVTYRTQDGGQYCAVQDVSFDVAEGESLVLLGPSGCGESTLLKAIACFEKPTTGQVLLDGKPVQRPSPKLAVVFQEFDQLLPWKSVLENVVWAMCVTGKFTRREAVDRAMNFLQMVGLSRYRDFYPHTLSGGMKQRCAIARSLALDPEVLLMDEPFGALDAQTRETLQLELHQIWKRTRKTILFVTHSIEEAAVLGSRILVMTPSPGRVRELLDNPVTGIEALNNAESLDRIRHIRSLLQFERGALVGDEVA